VSVCRSHGGQQVSPADYEVYAPAADPSGLTPDQLRRVLTSSNAITLIQRAIVSYTDLSVEARMALSYVVLDMHDAILTETPA